MDIINKLKAFNVGGAFSPLQAKYNAFIRDIIQELQEQRTPTAGRQEVLQIDSYGLQAPANAEAAYITLIKGKREVLIHTENEKIQISTPRPAPKTYTKPLRVKTIRAYTEKRKYFYMSTDMKRMLGQVVEVQANIF